MDEQDLYEETTAKIASNDHYRPEGNENGVLREFVFRLDEESLTEGLVFSETEGTYVPPKG